MSLKSFHIVFIMAASGLAFGFAIWELKEYMSDHGGTSDLALGLGSLAAGVALLIYGRYFLKKLKKVSYL